MKYHLFQSTNNPENSITIGETVDGLYFIPAAIGQVPDEENLFSTIQDVEEVLNDSLVLLRPKAEEQ